MKKLRSNEFSRASRFLAELESTGPILTGRRGFTRLRLGNLWKYHLTYNLVAIWEYDKKAEVIKVIYIGRREDAPYSRLEGRIKGHKNNT